MKKSKKLISVLTAACMLLSAIPGFAEEITDNTKTVTYEKKNHVSYVNYMQYNLNSRLYVNEQTEFPANNNVLYVDFDNIKYPEYITNAVLEIKGDIMSERGTTIYYSTNEEYMENNLPANGIYYWQGTEEDPDGTEENPDICYNHFLRLAGIFANVPSYVCRNSTNTAESYVIDSNAEDYEIIQMKDVSGSSGWEMPDGSTSYLSNKDLISTVPLKTAETDEEGSSNTLYATTNLPLTEDSVGYNLSGQTSINLSGQIKFDLTGLMDSGNESFLENLKKSQGRVAFMMRGGNNIKYDLSNAKLHLTYDMTSITPVIEAEIAAADTAEKVKRVVDDYNSFIGIDTKLISNMNYAYADVAKNIPGTTYTVETFKSAVEDAAKGYIRTYTYEQNNYVIYNRHDDGFVPGLYVNQPIVSRNDNLSIAMSSLWSSQWQFMSSFDIKNVDAIKNISYKSTWLTVGEGKNIQFITNVTDSFPLNIKSGFTADSENINYFSSDKSINPKAESTSRNAADGNAVVVGVDSFDCSGRIEDIKEVYQNSGSAALTIAINGELTSEWSLTDMPTLDVTYDMTAIMDGFNAEVSNADTADKLKNVVEKYNNFIGVNTKVLVNMENVYNELSNKNYTFDTIEQLKEDFNTAADKYLITVTYDMPSDYIIYKKPGTGSWDGRINNNVVLVNTPFAEIDTNHIYFKINSGRGLDSYYASVILSYDIPNPQAVTDVEFTAKANLRNTADINSDITKNCRVAWDVCDEPITQAGVGYYYDDAENENDVYDEIKTYYSNNKSADTTVYSITDTAGEITQTSMQIPAAVKDELQSAPGNTKKLALIFNSDFKRHLISPTDDHTLKLTYDLTALTEGARAFETDGFKAHTLKADDRSVLLNDGARIELTQTSKDITGNVTVLAAAYKEGKLIKAVPQTITAPGFMGRTIVTINGFDDVEYDELKIIALDGLQNIKPLSLSKNISLE